MSTIPRVVVKQMRRREGNIDRSSMEEENVKDETNQTQVLVLVSKEDDKRG